MESSLSSVIGVQPEEVIDPYEVIGSAMMVTYLL